MFRCLWLKKLPGRGQLEQDEKCDLEKLTEYTQSKSFGILCLAFRSGISGPNEKIITKASIGFLGQGSYTVELIADGATPDSFAFLTQICH